MATPLGGESEFPTQPEELPKSQAHDDPFRPDAIRAIFGGVILAATLWTGHALLNPAKNAVINASDSGAAVTFAVCCGFLGIVFGFMYADHR